MDSRRDGFGVHRWANESVFYGQWRCGKKHGWGKYTFASGEIYVGHWNSDLRHGPGINVYASGEIYNGTWYMSQEFYPPFYPPSAHHTNGF